MLFTLTELGREGGPELDTVGEATTALRQAVIDSMADARRRGLTVVANRTPSGVTLWLGGNVWSAFSIVRVG